jgi:hypothetical protein
MKKHRRHAILISVTAVAICLAAPPANGGGFFGMHIGTGGFGVSVGYGDWGVYTRSWSDPYWSLDFNASLDGYGQWVWVNGLGRVWRPWVSVGWRPYTHGRWVATGVNWTWVAYEPWGYIPHHYGSWAYCSFGWVWQPGYSYHHANVVWARSGSYVGWYARPPHGWSHAAHGFRHGYRHGYRDGYSDGWHDARYGTYVDWRHVGADNVSHHAVSHTMAVRNRLENDATQPSATEVRRRGGVTMPQTQLSRRTVRIGDREVMIARPEGVAPSIERNAAATAAGALGAEALERRQPLVRPHRAPAAAASAAASPSRGALTDNQVSRRHEVRQRTLSSSSSRSSRSAPSAVRRSTKPTANGAKPTTYSTRHHVAAGRPSSRGSVNREMSQGRRSTETRSSAAPNDHRSSRARTAQTSSQNRRSAAKPDAASVQRSSKKPPARVNSENRSGNRAERKQAQRRSTGASRR